MELKLNRHKIKQEIQNNFYSQAEFAREIDLMPANLSKILTGKQEPELSTFFDIIAKLIEVSEDFDIDDCIITDNN